jgi:hypothetical protein
VEGNNDSTASTGTCTYPRWERALDAHVVNSVGPIEHTDDVNAA